ncbi:unnamed protein product [Acanthoscelides obtectus]|uniref:Uncharacterized protein n=1 Tax=Acanthoscelides obtectus TaxID=200917 RepID=A0A9P0PI51_ACAOB|nr:unnamed protein product [Acanthoscelides obtectus]CAK1659832.1 hypothetical protein AOBTE_LOCUS21697 [Acanthoscelides obtectus]
MVATFVSKAGHIATILLNEQRTVSADIPPFVCQKSSPSFEKSNPKEESSSTKTMQARTQPKKQGSI